MTKWMYEQTHTPGPWAGQMKPSTGKCFIQTEDGKRFICELHGNPETLIADTNLIAAAPTMYATLKAVREELLAAYETLETAEEEREHLALIDEAIKEAEGKS